MRNGNVKGPGFRYIDPLIYLAYPSAFHALSSSTPSAHNPKPLLEQMLSGDTGMIDNFPPGWDDLIIRDNAYSTTDTKEPNVELIHLSCIGKHRGNHRFILNSDHYPRIEFFTPPDNVLKNGKWADDLYNKLPNADKFGTNLTYYKYNR